PDANPEAAVLGQSLPEPGRAEPAVLVVYGRDPAGQGELDAHPHRVDVLVVRDEHEALLEAPGRLLAQNPGRRATLVAFDHAAGHLELAVRHRQRGRVEPQRVV